MNRLPIFLIAVLLLPTIAHAKAYFASKEEMISNSDLIAVVDITDLAAAETGKRLRDELATATVKTTLIGRSKGDYLVFLSKGKQEMEGCNWHLSYRPVKDGKVEWFKKGSRNELEWQPQDEVLKDIKSHTAKVSSGPIPYGEYPEFTRWLKQPDFAVRLGKLPDNLYPIAVQGGPLEGDGVVYRMLLVQKPTKDFRSEVVYGAKESEFGARNEELQRNGFVLIQHQTVQLFSFKAHQAVWVKNTDLGATEKQLDGQPQEDVPNDVHSANAKTRYRSVPYGKYSEFTGWLEQPDVAVRLGKLSDELYPIAVQGGPLDGDGVVYRMLLVEKPTKDFRSEVVYGVKDSEFGARNAELQRNGFVLIQHQTVQLISFEAHQAVWAKSR